MHNVDVIPHTLHRDFTTADHHAADAGVLLDRIESCGGVEHAAGGHQACQVRVRHGTRKNGLPDFLGRSRGVVGGKQSSHTRDMWGSHRGALLHAVGVVGQSRQDVDTRGTDVDARGTDVREASEVVELVGRGDGDDVIGVVRGGVEGDRVVVE